ESRPGRGAVVRDRAALAAALGLIEGDLAADDGAPARLCTFPPPAAAPPPRKPRPLTTRTHPRREGTQFRIPRLRHAVANEFLLIGNPPLAWARDVREGCVMCAPGIAPGSTSPYLGRPLLVIKPSRRC